MPSMIVVIVARLEPPHVARAASCFTALLAASMPDPAIDAAAGLL
jgi:hypothetical protein